MTEQVNKEKFASKEQQQDPEDVLDMEFVESKVEDKSYFATFFDQMLIMLKRNLILQLRYTKSTFSQTIAAPFVFLICLLILQQADYNNQRQSILNPTPFPLNGLDSCRGLKASDPCINVMFTPNTEPYISIMNIFAKKNAERTNTGALKIETSITDAKTLPSSKLGMVPVPSTDFIYQYTLSNPNVTEWGVSFTNTTSPVNVQYQLWYNSSQTLNGSDVFGSKLLSFMRALDESIISYLNDPRGDTLASYDINLKDWPVIPPSNISDGVIQSLGPVFFFCSVMVIFINVLNQIVSEKELKLRHGLEVMGLKPAVYWISHFLSVSSLVFINSLFTVIFGIILNFATFRNTNFGVLLVLFFLFGEAMIMMAFFITTFIRNSNVAVLSGISVFIIGLLFESFVFSSQFLGYVWWDANTDPIIWKFLILIPFFNFGKAFLDIATMTVGKLDLLTDTFIPGPGFSWDSLYSSIPDNLKPIYRSGNIVSIPPTVDSFYYLLMNMVIFAVLTWYFDNVIPNEFGKRNPLWFFVTSEYWNASFEKSSDDQKVNQAKWLEALLKSNKEPNTEELTGEDADVKKERKMTLNTENFSAFKVANLRKEYVSGFIPKRIKRKVAVKNLCIHFEEGKLLALLGQNGAGKSTTMNILSGLTPATAGDGNVYGYSVRTQMHIIQRFMGICPQHDILFNDLTAREHIELYAGVKGVPKKDWAKLTESRLKAVRLWKVADQRAGTYSGGMKRRLSVAISTIGDPKVVFMDEPTTGMDPVNRRHVWSFIEKFKKDRVVVLTTHSMEEADVLGDRIAIMAHGRLRAIDNSISLKNKYGAGYRISVVTDPLKIEQTKAAIQSRVPEAVLEDDSAGALIYQLPLASTNRIPTFAKYLEANPDGLIRTWGVSQTTLEEVFLKIIRDANPEGYSGYEQVPAAPK